MASLQAYSGAWTQKQVAHLLKRTQFGSPIQLMDQLISKGMSNSVDDLLKTGTTTPPLNYYEGINVDGSPFKDADGVKLGETWINGTYGDGTTNFFRGESIKAWWLHNQLKQNATIEEKMILFWHNHFVTELNSGGGAVPYYHLIELFRTQALGNFRTLMTGVTKNAYMLFYLNGYLNTRYSPDENYARELQELFGVGKGVDAKFTESDVREMARALTGLSIEWNSQTFLFRDVLHDTGNKTFSSFYGNRVINGSSGSAGVNEVDEIIDMILDTQECARFICRKIYHFFVHHDITSEIETDIIVPLASLLRNGNYEIKPVMEKLLKSEHFYDVSIIGCQLKSPLDIVVGLGREMKNTLPPSTDTYKLYTEVLYTYYYNAAAMQLALGNPPNVAGWPAWYQIPAYYQLWINSDTLPKRVNFCLAMLYGFFAYPIDHIQAASAFTNVQDPGKFIDDLTAMLFTGVTVSSTYKQVLKTTTLLSGQAQDHYWTDAWNSYLNNPGDNTARQTVTSRLKVLFEALLTTSEYQLC